MLRLGKISKDLNPIKIYQLIAKLNKTKYFLSKFGFSESNFQNILNHPDVNLDSIKNNIKPTMHDTAKKTLSIEIILTSLIKSNPMYKSILSNMKLDLEDLYDGIRFLDEKDEFILENQIHARDSINMIFSRRKHKQVMLIGNESCGKTHLLKNLVKDSLYIDAQQLVKHSRATVSKKLNKSILSADQDILIIDNANLILEETSLGQDHSELFNKIIAKNKKIIFSMNTFAYNKLQSRLPKQFKDFNLIKMQDFSKEDSLRILFKWSKKIENTKNLIIGYNALKTAYELSYKVSKNKHSVAIAIEILNKIIKNTKSKHITALDVWSYFESLNLVKQTPEPINYYIFSTSQPSQEYLLSLSPVDEYKMYFFDLSQNDILDLENVFDYVRNYPNTVLNLHNLDKANQRLLSLIHQIVDDRYYESINGFVDFNNVIFVGSSLVDENELNDYLARGYDKLRIQDMLLSKFESNNLIKRFDKLIFII